MLTEFPFIEKDLIIKLESLYPLADANLQDTEWNRAYLCGQRSVVKKLKSLHDQQEKLNDKATAQRRA